MKHQDPSRPTSTLATSPKDRTEGMRSDWSIPAIPAGLAGWLARLTGPGATPTELLLQTLIPSAFAGFAIYQGMESLNVLQRILIGVLAFDIAGGVITNATSSAKRWYHRTSQTFWHHYAFISLHLLHLGVVAYFFEAGMVWFLWNSIFLLLASALILLVPLYLQRPVSLALYGFILIIILYNESGTPAMPWFAPLFYLKLLVSHLPLEEPYRPADDSREELALLRNGPPDASRQMR